MMAAIITRADGLECCSYRRALVNYPHQICFYPTSFTEINKVGNSLILFLGQPVTLTHSHPWVLWNHRLSAC